MNLIKETITLPKTLSAGSDVEKKRSELMVASRAVVKVSNSAEQTQAVEAGREIQTWCARVEKARVEITKPLLDSQRLIKKLADEHCEPLEKEKSRLQGLVNGFQDQERKRVEAEEKARQDEIDRLEAERVRLEKLSKSSKPSRIPSKVSVVENKLQAVIIAPLPQVQKSSGAATSKVMRYEVTDINALHKARPDLVRVEANASAILNGCVPESPVPGLKLWWENRTSFRKF